MIYVSIIFRSLKYLVYGTHTLVCDTNFLLKSKLKYYDPMVEASDGQKFSDTDTIHNRLTGN